MVLTVQRPTVPAATPNAGGGGTRPPGGTPGQGNPGSINPQLLELLFLTLGSQGFGNASAGRKNNLLNLLQIVGGGQGRGGTNKLSPDQAGTAIRQMLQLGNEPGGAGAGGQR